MAYSEQDKAVALAYYKSCGENQRKTARDCKVPLATLQNWLRGEHVNDAVTEKVVMEKQNIADMLEALVFKAIPHAEASMEDASFAQTMTGVGIAVDKMRLLREQPTGITAHQDNRRSALDDLLGYHLDDGDTKPSHLPN